LLPRAEGAGAQLDGLHRHRPQQLDRHPSHVRGRPDVVLLDHPRQQCPRRAAVLRVRIPRPARQLGGDIAIAVTVEDGVGKLDGHGPEPTGPLLTPVSGFSYRPPHAGVRTSLRGSRVIVRLLEGKVALITGAASGQGRAASVLFAEHGARIAVADMNDDGARETVDFVEEAGSKAIAVHADVSHRADNDAMVAAAVDTFGGLDVLYNNAAIQMSGRLVDCTEEQWDITIATNLSAIFWACRAAMPHLSEGDGGSIINTASVLGLIGSVGYAAYGAAKAGLVALTRQIATEYGPKVRANAIAPGSIDTPRFRKVAAQMDDGEGFVKGLLENIPLKRLGTAAD